MARHLAESKDCAVAYSDTSFRVVRWAWTWRSLEALYIKALAPNLCVPPEVLHYTSTRHNLCSLQDARGNQSELHFREHARRPQTWSQKTRLPTCQQKRWNLGRSLRAASPQWQGILQRAKIVPWLTVTLRFVLSVLVRWVWTWRSWRLCTIRLKHQTFVCRSPPLHIYNFSVTANNTSLEVFFFLSPH